MNISGDCEFFRLMCKYSETSEWQTPAGFKEFVRY